MKKYLLIPALLLSAIVTANAHNCAEKKNANLNPRKNVARRNLVVVVLANPAVPTKKRPKRLLDRESIIYF